MQHALHQQHDGQLRIPGPPPLFMDCRVPRIVPPPNTTWHQAKVVYPPGKGQIVPPPCQEMQQLATWSAQQCAPTPNLVGDGAGGRQTAEPPPGKLPPPVAPRSLEDWRAEAHVQIRPVPPPPPTVPKLKQQRPEAPTPIPPEWKKMPSNGPKHWYKHSGSGKQPDESAKLPATASCRQKDAPWRLSKECDDTQPDSSSHKHASTEASSSSHTYRATKPDSSKHTRAATEPASSSHQCADTDRTQKPAHNTKKRIVYGLPKHVIDVDAIEEKKAQKPKRRRKHSIEAQAEAAKAAEAKPRPTMQAPRPSRQASAINVAPPQKKAAGRRRRSKKKPPPSQQREIIIPVNKSPPQSTTVNNSPPQSTTHRQRRKDMQWQQHAPC